jgi:alkanesulfonate monooxygenase SsuD/methylene tetrahydromethanopterin reductase-like flavin-dependent oxidoreductase (luciferase family)
MEIGVLLPHFGQGSNHERLFDFTPQLEEMGFDGAWVRDQIGFTGGHSFEKPSNRFVDPFITLTAIAARTKRMKIGTATIIPFRHPAVVAQLVGSLSYLSNDRFVLGVGAGTPKKTFEITGIPYPQRMQLIKETVLACRALAEPHASFEGELVSFTDATIDPSPPRDLEVWYGGSTFISVERALDYCTGWFPGRCPLPVFDEKVARLREGAAEQGRTMKVAIIPVISIAADRETALAKVNVDGLLEEAHERKGWASAGPFETAEDLRGLLIAGTPDDVIAGLKDYEERGVDHLVLDFRLRMDRYEDDVRWIAQDVLPAFKTAQPAAAGG